MKAILNFTSDLGDCYTYFYKGKRFYKMTIDGNVFHSITSRTECFEILLKVCGRIPTEIKSFSQCKEDKVNAKVLIPVSGVFIPDYTQIKDMWRRDDFFLNGHTFKNWTNFAYDGKTI